MTEKSDDLFSEMDDFDDANWDVSLSEDDSVGLIHPLPNDEIIDYEELED